MRYFPRLSMSVWALLALLLGSSLACLAPAWSADQKPLVINPTTGRTEQIQSSNNLSLPANGYTQANTYTNPIANYNPFLVDTTTSIPAGNNAFVGSNRFIMRTSGGNNFTASAGIRALYGSGVHGGTGTVTGVWGVNADVSATSTGGITRAICVRAGSVSTSAANVIGTGNGVYIGAPSISGGGAITTYNALEIEPITGATTNRAIFTQGAGLVVIGDTTEASAVGTAGVVTASGLGVAKRSYLGTIGATFKGNVLAGVQDGTAAVSGQVGETLQAIQSTYTNMAGSGTYGQITSGSLTPGAWLITGSITISVNSATITAGTNSIATISTTTASAAGTTEGSGDIVYVNTPTGAATRHTMTLNKVINISATTTYYLNAQCTYSAGNPQAVGSLTAVRIR